LLRTGGNEDDVEIRAVVTERPVAPITPADLPQVTDMLCRVGHELGNDWAQVDEVEVARFVGSGVPGRGVLFGVRVDDRLVGFASLERRPLRQTAIGILGLHVLAPYRRQGLGERLLRATLQAASRGEWAEEVRAILAAHAIAEMRPWPRITLFEDVWLSVDPGNKPALRLYEKLGFVRSPPPPVNWAVQAGFLTMVRAVSTGYRAAGLLPGQKADRRR
jgi:ribosomal protein S18 acetylase RimI-like enzyme